MSSTMTVSVGGVAIEMGDLGLVTIVGSFDPSATKKEKGKRHDSHTINSSLLLKDYNDS